MKNILPIVVVAILSVGSYIFGLNMGDKPVELGALSSPEIQSYINVYGELGYRMKTTEIAKTSVYSTSTFTIADSGTNYLISASGTTMILPDVSQEGTIFRFTISDAIDTGNAIIKSAEGDNIEGTLVVAGAVVDCDAEDFINFIADGENIGDFVELYSDGSSWLIGDSGVLTSGKMTCTDPS